MKKFPPGSFRIEHNQDISINLRYITDKRFNISIAIEHADQTIKVKAAAFITYGKDKKANGVNIHVWKFADRLPLSTAANVLKILAAEETRIITKIQAAANDDELILYGGYF
jgi:hypothetical protein